VIRFERVDKVFGGADSGPVVALDGFDLEVAEGEVHCLIGTSGCGKTTALRLVNRLEEPTRGRVSVGGEDVAALDVYALRRRIGYVIQSGGLFPHMTVAQNIGLLASSEGWAPARIEARVAQLLELVALPVADFGHRYPAELSGGQCQRVGVARVLVLDPGIVLMDEPFGALDPITRSELREEFSGLLRRVAKTVLLVTHDLDEAFELGDRVTVMRDGRAVQTGTRAQLGAADADPFVRRFVSSAGRSASC